MATRLLQDEIPTRQDALTRALHELGADVLDDDCDQETVAWGSDPFDILLHKEQAGNDD